MFSSKNFSVFHFPFSIFNFPFSVPQDFLNLTVAIWASRFVNEFVFCAEENAFADVKNVCRVF